MWRRGIWRRPAGRSRSRRWRRRRARRRPRRRAGMGRSLPFTSAEAARAALVIDAVFGAGLARDVADDGRRGAARGAAHRRPSMCRAASTAPPARCAATRRRRVLTVTFFRRKPGHLLLPGRTLCGETVLADIGMPDAALDGRRARARSTTGRRCGACRFRRRTDHKYSRGHVTVLGGARDDRGGAAGGGGGAARRRRHGDDRGRRRRRHLSRRRAGHDRRWPAARGTAARRAAQRLGVRPRPRASRRRARRCRCCWPSGRAVVVDADALTACAGAPERLRGAAVLTPHAGEFARVFGPPGADRLAAARAAAARTGAVVLLKGADTIIAAPDGRAAINDSAPPWLATAGAGDVLAGLIAGAAGAGHAGLGGRLRRRLAARPRRRPCRPPSDRRGPRAGAAARLQGCHDMSEPAALPTGLFDRALRRITGVWRDMAPGVGARGGRQHRRARCSACLAGRGGEVSARNRAAKLAQTYLALDRRRDGADFLRNARRLRFRPRGGRRRLRGRARGRRSGGARRRQGAVAPRAGTAAARGC